MRIKFNSNQTVEAQGEIVKKFTKGEVYELSTPSARRWIRRNLAVEVQGAVTPATTKSDTKAEAVAPKPKRKYVRKKPLGGKPAASKSNDSDTGGRAKPDAK